MHRPGSRDDLTDVRGVRVGHHQRDGRGWMTGVTVVVPPARTVGAVDSRGGAPGTRETDALDPRNVAAYVDAIALCGGSAYGLAAADGVMAWLEEHQRGVRVGRRRAHVVPVVPAAVIFDLGRAGRFDHRPDASFGRAAAAAAATHPTPAPITQGSVGAGTGARAGAIKGGLGSASLVLDRGVTVAALVVVNAAGSTVDRRTGRLLGAAFIEESGLAAPRAPTIVERDRLFAHLLSALPPPMNTTLAVVATNADLGKAEAQRMAGVAHDGLARAIRPLHSYADGDVVFALATGRRPLTTSQQRAAEWRRARVVELNVILSATADVATRATVRAMLAATGRPGVPSYRDLCPSVVEALASRS